MFQFRKHSWNCRITLFSPISFVILSGIRLRYEGLPLAWELSLENSAHCFLCFRMALLHPVPYFFFLYRSSSLSFCTAFDVISSNIDEVPSINPSANVFVFGDFNVHHKDWLTYSGRTDGPSKACYNFSISYDITQMVNFPTWIPDCDSHSPSFLWIYFFGLYDGFPSTEKF